MLSENKVTFGADSIESLFQEVKERPVDYLLIKLASSCNYDCEYCYWFADESVRRKPKIITEEAESIFLEKLADHVNRYNIRSFHFLFHGGEPLLIGRPRFAALLRRLSEISSDSGCLFTYSVTTNGGLIDTEWCRLFLNFRVKVSVSIDGPEYIHDSRRLNAVGKGTYHKTVSAINLMRDLGLNPGILAVYHPDAEARAFINFFVDEMNFDSFNILIPDATHSSDSRVRFARFFCEVFDLWWDFYRHKDVEIGFCKNVIRGLLGRSAKTESFGYGPISTLTLLTDGTIEPLDVVRIIGDGFTSSEISVFTNEIQEGKSHPLWLSLLHQSLNLHSTCEACQFKTACGGGHIASRWSQESGFNNPSAHCDEYQILFTHVWNRIRNDVYFA
jgi:uncharacterized protein